MNRPGPATPRLDDSAIPRLARGVRTRWDATRKTTMLLAPERALKLDAVATAILEMVDGERRFFEIVDELAAKYQAPRDRIETDARDFLIGLMDKRMVEVAP